MNAGRRDTWVCVASGPSLTREQVEYCWGKAQMIVVNDNYILAPWADILYAGDIGWWEHHIDRARKVFQGELMTCREDVANDYGIHHAVLDSHNSGHQAVELASMMGARRIVLLGYDMQSTDGHKHWHTDHPAPLNNDHQYGPWVEALTDMIEELKVRGVEVYNCTRHSALNYRMPLEWVL